MSDPCPEAVEDGLLLADGFEEAFIGTGRRLCSCGSNTVAVYDVDECIAVLMRRDKMSYEEAVEFFEFNVSGAYVGPRTPMFVELKTLPEVLDDLEEYA